MAFEDETNFLESDYPTYPEDFPGGATSKDLYGDNNHTNGRNSDIGFGVGNNLTEDLRLKVIAYRNERYKLFKARYYELISNIRNYTGLPQSINKFKLENLLRSGYDVAIGKNAKGVHSIMGVINQDMTVSSPQNYFNYPLTGASINWLVPEAYRPTLKGSYTEITELDNGVSGDFVILRNKSIRYVNDFELIELSARNVAELEASRYSLLIQSKVSTVFLGEQDDESINQAISNLWNGAPFMKVDDTYNVENRVLELGAVNAGRMKELKETYADIIEELNNNFGINSVGINKLSGVSSDEVNGNNSYVQNNANIYINGIEEPLRLYNNRYGTDYHVYINGVSTSDVNQELSEEEAENNE